METLGVPSPPLPCKSFLNSTTRTEITLKLGVFRQMGVVSTLWRQKRNNLGSLTLGRSVSGGEKGGFRSSQDGSSTMEDKEEEEGLLLGAERDDSVSVVGFHLIPPSGDSKAISTLDKLATDGEEVTEDIEREEKIPTRVTHNIIFVTAEVAPYSKTGGLGDVCGSLPIALAARGHRVMVSLLDICMVAHQIRTFLVHLMLVAASRFDTTRRFFVDTVQISPLQRPMKWESVITFSSPSAKSFAFPVEGGRTMELVIAQFWSSGIGSHEATVVEFEIGFHGININKEEVVLDGSDAPARIDAEALLSSEKLAPAAILSKIRIPYRPIDAKLCTLPTDRDKLLSGTDGTLPPKQ